MSHKMFRKAYADATTSPGAKADAYAAASAVVQW